MVYQELPGKMSWDVGDRDMEVVWGILVAFLPRMGEIWKMESTRLIMGIRDFR